jgi:hypothetical protein
MAVFNGGRIFAILEILSFRKKSRLFLHKMSMQSRFSHYSAVRKLLLRRIVPKVSADIVSRRFLPSTCAVLEESRSGTLVHPIEVC